MVRPAGVEEIQSVLAYAWEHGVPVTVAGGLSGLAGGAVAEGGILLTTAKLKNPLQVEVVDSDRARVRAGVGWLLGDLQREVEKAGWLYPPDPTSRNEAFLGGTLATNATGEDTLLYGPTRRWVEALEVVAADGKRHTVTREREAPREEKATAGYFLGGEPIDWFIGSEGTLGVITEAVLRLCRIPSRVFSGLAFFPTLSAGLDFVVRARDDSAVTPRALELMDGPALELVSDNPEGVKWPSGTAAAVLFRQESPDGSDLLESWLRVVSEAADGRDEWTDAVLLFETRRDQERLREFRHRIPAALQEKAAKLRDQGGAKVGTDWWVPYRSLPGMLGRWVSRLQEEEKLDTFVFGHAGNGHPHVNMMAQNRDQTGRARELVLSMCREAVELGGGVAGEHGLGKLKRDLLEIQYPGGTAAMKDLKRQWDPRWILGRGNIVPSEDS